VNELIGLLTRLAPGSALVTLIAFAVTAVWRGWLVPRATIEKLEEAQRTVVEIQEKRLAEAIARENEWRKAYETSRTANDILLGHVDDVLTGLSTVENLVRDLPRGRDERGPT
jgi:hypothetical protein